MGRKMGVLPFWNVLVFLNVFYKTNGKALAGDKIR